jgi:cytochrome c peroxidase
LGRGSVGPAIQRPSTLTTRCTIFKVERFYTPRTINGEWIHAEGPIKTFTLRGIKDSPPYLHDGRLLTLEDTVEFFNLVLGVQLTAREKTTLVAFLRQL